MTSTLLQRAQRGQAMVEFVVAATFFLVPLFLALVVMGKFSDVQHTANMAARYGAWERTVWYDDQGTMFETYNGANHKTAAQISNEIGVRVFNDRSQTTSIIKDTDKSATTFANGIDPMWRDNANVAYLASFDQQTNAINRETPKTDVAGKVIDLIKALPLPSAVTGTIVPPVPNDTLAISKMSLTGVGRDSAAYQRLWPKEGVWVADWAGVDFTATGAILSNTWAANGSDSTKKMVEESVPMAKGLGDVAGKVVTGAMFAWDPVAIGNPLDPKVKWGKVTPDVVPPDRLK